MNQQDDEQSPWAFVAEHDPEREAFNSAQRELNTQERAFFEKLALLDGGIVGLVVSAVIGPLHEQLRHKHTLVLALTCLILGMGFLLIRTYYGINHQRGVINESYIPHAHFPRHVVESALFMRFYSFLGCFLTIAGISLLVVEVWLII
jgi:F0F1-type ATP synthase assembly protein I